MPGAWQGLLRGNVRFISAPGGRPGTPARHPRTFTPAGMLCSRVSQVALDSLIRVPPPPGPLEAQQTQWQLSLVEQVRRTALSRRESMDQLRRAAEELAAELQRVLPQVAERRRWAPHQV